MAKNKITSFFLSIIIVFLFMTSAVEALAQKGNDPNVYNPDNSIVSARYDQVRKQVIAERENSRWGTQTNNGINYNGDMRSFLTNNRRVWLHFITKDKLIDLLYFTNLATDAQNFGVRIWFSKNKNELALVRAAGPDSSIRDLTDDYLWLSPTSEKPNDGLQRLPVKLPLKTVQHEFKYKIKGYFIGRNSIMRSLIDDEGNVKLSVSGIQIDVRENIKHDYSIVFYVVNNDRTTTYIGLASFAETFASGGGITTLDKMGSCRPCPPYCNN